MKTEAQRAAEEAEIFRQGMAIHEGEKQQELVAMRATCELIEIKFLLRALVEKAGVDLGGPGQKE